jgi:hypothetical protein
MSFSDSLNPTYLPSLSNTAMSTAKELSFTLYTNPMPQYPNTWDNRAYYSTYEYTSEIFKISMKEGATYDLFSDSFFDPFILMIYKNDGTPVAANSENNDYSYDADDIFDFIAPYTGDFYIDASWHQGSYYKSAYLSVYEDIDTIPVVPTISPYYVSIDSASTGSVTENAAIDTVIYDTNGSYRSDTGAPLILSLSGEDVSLININQSDGIVTLKAPADYETKSSYSFDVTASVGTASVTKAIIVTVVDVIENSVVANTVTGNELNNSFNSSSSDDFMDGGSGTDTVYFAGTKNSYVISMDNGNIDINGTDGHDILTNIERIQFSDCVVAYDTDGNAGEAYRIYKAAFDRAPDQGGLGYWIHAKDNGASLTQIADSFLASQEFEAMYGTNPTNEAFVTLLYNNVLDRTPDADGMSYWLNNLNTGALTKAGVLASFSESVENQSNVATLIGNGIDYILWS